MRQGVVDAEGDAAADDLRFGELDQRRDDSRLSLFHSASRSLENHLLKRVDKLRPAIRIPAEVHRIDPDPYLLSIARFREAKGDGEKDRVAGGHVRDRDSGRADGIFWNLDVARQRAGAEEAKVERVGDMFSDGHGFSDACGRLKLHFMALTVRK